MKFYIRELYLVLICVYNSLKHLVYAKCSPVEKYIASNPTNVHIN